MGALVQINKGDKFGRWTVLQRTVGSGGKGQKVYYDCICDCGTIKSVCGASLRKGVSRSCGCYSKEQNSKNKKINLQGQRFGRLVVLQELNERINNKVVWLCQCDCGQQTSVMSTQLISGKTQSCGCLHKEKMSKYFIKDITGLKSGKLVALEPTAKRSQNCVVWKCQCDCGKTYEVASTYLVHQEVLSCGCSSVSKGELKIQSLLNDNKITFYEQKTFNSCRFLESNALARFDFYVNNQYLIEYDGEQHFQPVELFGGEEQFKIQQARDAYKNQWCKENNIPLIRIPYTKLDTLCIDDLLLETSQFIVK